jgi:hypothetical protein
VASSVALNAWTSTVIQNASSAVLDSLSQFFIQRSMMPMCFYVFKNTIIANSLGYSASMKIYHIWRGASDLQVNSISLLPNKDDQNASSEHMWSFGKYWCFHPNSAAYDRFVGQISAELTRTWNHLLGGATSMYALHELKVCLMKSFK